MRVFVAGGTGVIGRRLVPQLVARGHQVTATTTSAGKLGLLEQLGAEGVVMDGLDAASVGEAVAAARPDAIVHQMTALSVAHAGKPNLRQARPVLRHHQPAAQRGDRPPAGRRRGDRRLPRRRAGPRQHERNPRGRMGQDRGGPAGGGWRGRKAISHLEDVVVKAGGAVLRYGGFYGPGANDDQVELVRKRLFPLVGGGTGYFSWVHRRRRGERYRPGGGAEGEGRVQHRRRRAGPGQRVAALSRRVRRGEAAAAGPSVAGPAAGRRDGGGHDDRGARLLQRQGQAGARLGAALSVVAAGLQGRARMTRAEEFEELRPLLFAIAYRILGSVAEAEDAVQETWLRYEASPTQPTSTKAFLSAVVTRISIDVLRSARVRRETYVGQWFPEPLLTDPYEDPERSAELADSVSMAALLLLERLTPLERAVFVLREVFGFGFPEVAAAVGRSEAACRQLAVRARRHMDVGRPRFEADRREREELAARFFDALRDGDVDGLRELLAADVQLVGDGGGKAPALARSVIGADNVARVLAAIFPLLARIDASVEPHEVNGQPGAILRDRDGKVVGTLTLDVLDGRIQTIRSVVNPDKLGHLGPVADAWAVAREVKQARRPRD